MTEAVYTRSTGAQVRLADMATPHLKSALSKLQRDFPGHPEIGPMADEAERRDAAFAEAQRAFEHTAAVPEYQAEDPFHD